jgi:hypothetical protein
MKLGVAYNVFDAEELLEHSINSIRECVDFIVVVAQETSNYGNVNLNLRKTLSELKDRGLIDSIYWYKPTLIYDKKGNILSENGYENEQVKRQIGLDLCKYNQCRIFSSMDCDELYDKKQYEIAKDDFISGDYDSSFCQMRTFYKSAEYQIIPLESYYVPLFYKIDKNTKFTFAFIPPYPVEIDPTRRITAGHSLIYTRNEIEMYHYSYVRKSIITKIENSSARNEQKNSDLIINHFNNFTKITDGGLLLGNTLVDLIKVENIFNIKL